MFPYAKSDQIMKINNIASYNYMYAGKVLWLPVTACPAAPYYKVMAHKVAAGDTVYNLCLTNGIDFTANTALIQRLNGRENLTTFYVGQTLYLPLYVAGAATATATPTPTPAASGSTATPTPAPAATAGASASAAATATAKPATGDTVSYYLAKHVLQAGETMMDICNTLGIDFYAKSDQIMKINNIASYNYMYAGKVLWLPVSACPAAPYYKVMAHTIAAGDTVYDLCLTNGIDYSANADFIQRLNNRTDLTSFYVGQTLYLPVYVAS